jgi:pyruvate-ferredoxin/flavodoxin oxidoreductase
MIGDETDYFVQGYFIYDSFKAGSVTVSHLRFSRNPIKLPYRILHSNFVACHQFPFVERVPVMETAQEGAIFLLNSPYGPDALWDKLPRSVQQTIIDRKLRIHIIDAYKLGDELGLGRRINTIMQVCFFGLTKLLPTEQALEKIKNYIRKSYGRHGDSIVNVNLAAVDKTLERLHEFPCPAEATSAFDMRPPVPPDAPDFVRTRTAAMIGAQGDMLPVSAFDPDGAFPSGTIKYMKRNISRQIPVWDPGVCIQCGRCSMACPHAVVRAKLVDPAILAGAPPDFRSVPARFPAFRGNSFTIAVSPEDCTGCRLCVEVCPAKNKADPKERALNMRMQHPILERERANWAFFLTLPEFDTSKLSRTKVSDVQFLEPLFEFSGACAGCGETPYLTLLSRLFGDRALIANATGCSSIYGGNEPATPWTANRRGKGPAWSNSLFENNAEFGLGFRIALDNETGHATKLLRELAPAVGDDLVSALVESPQRTESELEEQRNRVAALVARLREMEKSASEETARKAANLLALSDSLTKKSVWLVGGDGWAYDIDFDGLDHVLALGKKVNILVMDTEVYSNTGGQMSKATPLGAVAKFAVRGKRTAKKDLVMMAMAYGSAYVARIAIGADAAHALTAFTEADSYGGTSIIVAYCPCIGQGYDLVHGMEQQRLAVQSGYWPLMRYNPDLRQKGKNPLQLDSPPPSIGLDKYMYNETRFRMLLHSDPEGAAVLLKRAQREVERRYGWYKHWASMMEQENV